MNCRAPLPLNVRRWKPLISAPEIGFSCIDCLCTHGVDLSNRAQIAATLSFRYYPLCDRHVTKHATQWMHRIACVRDSLRSAVRA